MMLSMKDLIFKERPVRKLVDQYISLYVIDEIISTNAVKLQLPTLIKIHPVVNISQIVQYREQVEEQKVEEVKSVKVDGVEEWGMEKFLNKIKIRGVVKYLVYQKRFIVEYDIWERKEDLVNTKKVVAEFEKRINIKVRQQEKLKKSTKQEEYSVLEIPKVDLVNFYFLVFYDLFSISLLSYSLVFLFLSLC